MSTSKCTCAQVEGWLEKASKTWKPAAVAITINSPGRTTLQSQKLPHTLAQQLATRKAPHLTAQ